MMSTASKSFKQKLAKELNSVAYAIIYFTTWLAILMFLKTMIPTEYKVEYSGITKAHIGALILAKMVVVIDLIPLSNWTREHSAVYLITFRTLINIVAVFILLLLERAFESRHEYGSFVSSLRQVFQHRDVYHVWVNITVVSIAVFWFNLIFVLRRFLVEQKLRQLFLSIPMSDLLSNDLRPV